MKRPVLLAIILGIGLAGCASLAIDDSQVSLRQASVFEVVKPTPFSFEGPGAAVTIAPSRGSGTPPMISHPVDEHLPITAKANDCRDCHDKPATIGKVVAAGKARPAPADHYAWRDGAPLALAGNVYNCMACHAPQAAVPHLVRNLSP